MKLGSVTWSGPPVDDADTLQRLYPDLRQLLSLTNGFILRGGLVHFRGASLGPRWHSLREAWIGESALARFYPSLTIDDLPIAESCTGDQFFLRAGAVWLLDAETGEVDKTIFDLSGFLAHVQEPQPSLLNSGALDQLHEEGGRLEPGQLIHVYPPYCTKESAAGVWVRAIPAEDLLRFHADFARQIRDIPDGEQIDVETDLD